MSRLTRQVEHLLSARLSPQKGKARSLQHDEAARLLRAARVLRATDLEKRCTLYMQANGVFPAVMKVDGGFRFAFCFFSSSSIRDPGYSFFFVCGVAQEDQNPVFALRLTGSEEIIIVHHPSSPTNLVGYILHTSQLRRELDVPSLNTSDVTRGLARLSNSGYLGSGAAHAWSSSGAVSTSSASATVAAAKRAVDLSLRKRAVDFDQLVPLLLDAAR